MGSKLTLKIHAKNALFLNTRHKFDKNIWYIKLVLQLFDSCLLLLCISNWLSLILLQKLRSDSCDRCSDVLVQFNHCHAVFYLDRLQSWFHFIDGKNTTNLKTLHDRLINLHKIHHLAIIVFLIFTLKWCVAFSESVYECFLGMGRCSSRVASRRIANNVNKQEGSDNDSVAGEEHDDWAVNKRSE